MKKSNMFRIVSGALLVALTLFTFVQQPVNAQAVQVTVCHAAGPANYVTINVSISSVDDANGLNGHGTHSGDAWGSFVFDGVSYPGQGDFSNCTTTVPDPDPVDVCPNLDGLQETIPDGYELDGQLQCVPTEGEPEDPGDPPVIISTVPFLIPVTGVESIDSGQLLLSLSGLGAGLTLLFKGLFGKDK